MCEKLKLTFIIPIYNYPPRHFPYASLLAESYEVPNTKEGTSQFRIKSREKHKLLDMT